MMNKAKFVELTTASNGKKTMVNVDHVVRFGPHSDNLGQCYVMLTGDVVFNVIGQYDEIKRLFAMACVGGSMQTAVSNSWAAVAAYDRSRQLNANQAQSLADSYEAYSVICGGTDELIPRPADLTGRGIKETNEIN